MHVHEMKNYGALQTGAHRFHHPGHDDTEPLGEAQFVHLWRLKDGDLEDYTGYQKRQLEAALEFTPASDQPPMIIGGSATSLGLTNKLANDGYRGIPRLPSGAGT